MARIDEIRFLRRSVPQREARLQRELERLGITETQAWSFRGRIDRIDKARSRLDQMEVWYTQLGDEWAKDDWPHAIHTRTLAVGAYAPGVNN